MRYYYKTGVIVPFAQKFYKQLTIAVAGLFLATIAAMSLGVNAATNATVLVTNDDLATNITDVQNDPTSWFFYNDETDSIDNSLGSFVTGPAVPPIGSGSVAIGVTGSQRRNLATYQFSGTKLADITQLKFSTYNPSAGNGGSADRSGYLNFNVDFNGTDTWQRRLVYVPSSNGSVLQNTWQEWDAISGGSAKWTYSGATWPVTGEPGSTAKTWSQVLSTYPTARVRVTDSWLGIRVGEPYADGYTENIDKFVFGTAAGTTTFNFDQALTPATKDECKNNGWKKFNTPTTFENQGQCVSFVTDTKSKNYVLSSTDIDGIDVPTKDDTWYEVVVKGTWTNRGVESVDTECTSYNGGAWANVVTGGYSPDLLDVQIDQDFLNWGNCDATTHTYNTWVMGDGDSINLRIFDGDVTTNTQNPSWFGDNVGSLNVTVIAHKSENNNKKCHHYNHNHDNKHNKRNQKWYNKKRWFR